MEPFFSFIIPTYNRASYLKKAIDSILNQSFSNFEIIIVDDGSTDNTEGCVKSFGDLRIEYFKIANSERGTARNFGLRYAKGIYINYFDSDDLYLPCLNQVEEFINANNFPAVFYGAIQQIAEDGTLIKKEPLPHISFIKNLLFNNFLACGSVFMKREIANQFLFHVDRRLSSAEDWELWLRVQTRFTFHNFPGSIFQQVQHSSRSLMTISPENIEIRDNYFTELIRSNKSMERFYGASAMNLFIADRYTFIALAWCGTDKQRAYLYWKKAIQASLNVLKRKRFWAILKKMLLSR